MNGGPTPHPGRRTGVKVTAWQVDHWSRVKKSRGDLFNDFPLKMFHDETLQIPLCPGMAHINAWLICPLALSFGRLLFTRHSYYVLT